MSILRCTCNQLQVGMLVALHSPKANIFDMLDVLSVMGRGRQVEPAAIASSTHRDSTISAHRNKHSSRCAPLLT